MTDREGSKDSQPYHLILLAKDWTGYQNLCRIVTDAHLDGYYYKPRIDRDYLAQHSEGLIGLSACLNGEVSRALETEDGTTRGSVAGELSATSSARATSSSSSRTTACPTSAASTSSCCASRPEIGLPLVATNDLHYVRREQHEAHDVLLCVGTAANLRHEPPAEVRHPRLLPEERGRDGGAVPGPARGDRQHAPDRRDDGPASCDFGHLRLPALPGAGRPHGGELAARRVRARPCARATATVTRGAAARLDYELGVITSMGYAGYFLIVADFVRFAREQGIATTCRGSAPGSIVTYTLGITPVDPIHYELPFERFLNPDRVTMPDIDVDFEDSRRDEVIAYVARKYGSDHVAQIITFGTMLARAAIRDVGRVLGLGYGEVDRIAKAVPNQLGIKLEEALADRAAAARDARRRTPECGKLHRAARQLEGVARNASTHAAGVVIAREPLTELMPLQRATNSEGLMTQYEMHGVEALGLLKFDFLGLSNLTILRQAVDLIEQQRGVDDRPRQPAARRRQDVRAARVRRDDRRVPARVAGHAPLRQGAPTDQRARPCGDGRALPAGPDGQHPGYIRRKHGQEQVTYLHPLLEPYLKKTYGIFVYQEDIMAAPWRSAGLRAPRRTRSATRSARRSRPCCERRRRSSSSARPRGESPPQTIDAVFKAFEPFERYGFNKAHATCYGLIAYQTAYLKANYTVEYMTSRIDRVPRLRPRRWPPRSPSAAGSGIEVRPPDVHAPGLDFTVEGDAIRFGLLAIKNVGQGAIESIVAARAEGGRVRSLRRLLLADRPAPRQPARARVADPWSVR